MTKKSTRARPAQSSAVKVRQRVLLDLPGDPVGQVGRDVELARVVEVLRLEVVELVVRRPPGSRPAATPPGAPPASPSSTPHSISRPTIAASTSTFGSICAGGGDRRVQVGPVGDLGDAVRRAGPRRLDEHRQARAAPCPPRTATAPARSTAYGPTGMPSAAASFLVNSLSMAAAEAKTFGADVRHAGHLQQALDGAVLAVGAVQRREHHVDAAQRAGARRPGRAPSSPLDGRVGGQHDGRAGRRR